MYFHKKDKVLYAHTEYGEHEIKDELTLDMIETADSYRIGGIIYLVISFIGLIVLFLLAGLNIKDSIFYVIAVFFICATLLFGILFSYIGEKVECYTQRVWLNTNEFKEIKIQGEKEQEEQRKREEALEKLNRKYQAQAILNMYNELESTHNKEDKIDAIAYAIEVIKNDKPSR